MRMCKASVRIGVCANMRVYLCVAMMFSAFLVYFEGRSYSSSSSSNSADSP